MYKKNALALGLIAACLTCVGVAQQNSTVESPAEVLKNIPHNSNDIEQLRAGLSSPDPSVRVATFSAMMQSNNPSLTTIAINEGHASSDATLRDLASRAAFGQLAGFNIEPKGVVPPEMEKAFLYFSTFGLRVKMRDYDSARGIFTVFGGGEGQISGSRLTFRAGFCLASLASVEGTWTYQGRVVCQNGTIVLSQEMTVTIR